jgi:hypothetical protein
MGRRLKNPSPLVVVGTLAGLGLVGYAGYEYMKEAKAAKPKSKKNGKKTIVCPDGTTLDRNTGECVAKTTPPSSVSDWGTGMKPSTQGLSQGVPFKVFQDTDGLWNFGYSWKTRNEGSGSGKLWNWLRAGDSEYDTLIVMSKEEGPALAHARATRWLENLNGRVEMFSANTDMEPGFFRTQGLDFAPMYIHGRDRWGLVIPMPSTRDGVPETTRYLEDPLEFGFVNVYPGYESTSGCCYSASEAGDHLDYE